MACGPVPPARKNRTRYGVVAADGSRVLLGPTERKPTAEVVSKRYAGSDSTVRESRGEEERTRKARR